MYFKAASKHKNFYCVGVGYKGASENIRGLFAIDDDHKRLLLTEAGNTGFTDLLVVSTCNRTELYGFAEHPFQLIKLLCEYSKGNTETFEKLGYVYKNNDAISYLFRVGAGLESQILGDFEITAQLKSGFKASKIHGLVSPFLERLFNAVVQASKRVKTETELSSGATSVAFAAVQYIIKTQKNLLNKKILLFGTGKIGRNACENLVKHSENKRITLINRTSKNAETLAGKFHLTQKNIANLPDELQSADIVIVATGSDTPTVTRSLIEKTRKNVLILDLSVPRNVEPSVADLPNVSLLTVDNLSQMTDETLARRRTQIPLAEAIIENVMIEFFEWLEGRRFAPVIQALKEKLTIIKNDELNFQSRKIENFQYQQAEIVADRFIQKITTHFANHLKANNAFAEENAELIQKVFQLEIQNHE